MARLTLPTFCFAVAALLCCARARAVAKATESPEEGRARAGLQSLQKFADGCESKRQEKQRTYVGMLHENGKVFDDIRDASRRQRMVSARCLLVDASPQGQQQKLPCSSGLNQALEYMLIADQKIGQNCETLRSLSIRASACDRGTAACLDDASKAFKEVNGRLAEVSALDSKIHASLRTALAQGNMFLEGFDNHMHAMAESLRKLKATKGAAQLNPDDPDVNQALGTLKIEGMGVRSLMHNTNIPELTPEAFDRKAKEYDDLLLGKTSTISGATPGDAFALQWATNKTTSETQQFAMQDLKQTQQTSMAIAEQAKVIDNLRQSLNAAQPSSQSIAANVAAASTPNPQVAASIDRGQAGAVSGIANTTGASRAVAFAESGSASVPAPVFSGSGSSESSYAPLPMAPQRDHALMFAPGATGVPAPEAENTSKPSAAFTGSPNAAEGPGAAKMAYIDNGKRNADRLAPVAEPRVHGAPFAAFAGAESAAEQKTAILSSFTRGLAGMSGASPGPSVASPTLISDPATLQAAVSRMPPAVAAKAEAFADAELAKASASRPMTSGLREQLRKRLLGTFAARYNEVEEAKRNSGTAGALGDVLTAARSSQEGEQKLDEDSFRMLASETDREVRRLTNDEEISSAGEMSQTDTTLFRRVHEAYARVSRR